MKHVQYVTHGTCSRLIDLTVDEDHVIQSCRFVGGCNGNLQGISALVCGHRAEEIIPLVERISCNGHPTSCPDQLAKALRQAIAEG